MAYEDTILLGSWVSLRSPNPFFSCSCTTFPLQLNSHLGSHTPHLLFSLLCTGFLRRNESTTTSFLPFLANSKRFFAPQTVSFQLSSVSFRLICCLFLTLST